MVRFIGLHVEGGKLIQSHDSMAKLGTQICPYSILFFKNASQAWIVDAHVCIECHPHLLNHLFGLGLEQK